MTKPFRELTGLVFGRMTVLERAPKGARFLSRWRCRCECGVVKVLYERPLIMGHVRSCGCLKKDNIGGPSKHGMYLSREYNSWSMMKSRCQYPKDISYPNYGGRGISVDERLMTFEGFYAALGPRPPGTSLDRIDTNGNYTPENCRWASIKDQSRNKTNTRWIEAFGMKKSINTWADEMGVPSYVLAGRLKCGWTPEKTVTEPVRPRRKSLPRIRPSVP